MVSKFHLIYGIFLILQAIRCQKSGRYLRFCHGSSFHVFNSFPSTAKVIPGHPKHKPCSGEKCSARDSSIELIREGVSPLARGRSVLPTLQVPEVCSCSWAPLVSVPPQGLSPCWELLKALSKAILGNFFLHLRFMSLLLRCDRAKISWWSHTRIAF